MWLTIIIAGILTYLIRLSFIWLFSKREIPPFIIKALRFVPPAVLTAIIFPEMFLSSGTLVLNLSNNRLLAGCLAVFIAWRTKSVLVTIVAGMLALWALLII